MHRIMLFVWIGFAVLGVAFIVMAVSLDLPNWPEAQCRTKWARTRLATWSYGTRCMVYVNRMWVPGSQIYFRARLKPRRQQTN